MRLPSLHLVIPCTLLVACFAKTDRNTVARPNSTELPKQNINDSTLTNAKISIGTLNDLLTFESEEALITTFGASNVARDIYQNSEVEGTWPTSVLFPDTKNEVIFIWNDTVSFVGLSKITHSANSEHAYVSDWKTSEGIALGTAIPELEKFNGGPFIFYAFGWNFEGQVVWTNPETHARGVYVALRIPEENRSKGLSINEVGEQVSSDSEQAISANLRVAYIELRKKE